MATKRPRYMISVDDELFHEIEDFRFLNRYQTRSEATAELIRLGLESLKKDAVIKLSPKSEEDKSYLEPIAAHNDDLSLEQLELMKKDLDDL